jgi:hypothetical protein
MNAEDYKQLLIDNREKGFEHPDIVAKMNSMTDTEIDIFCVYELGISETRGEREIVDLWYDEYERFNGDGYYPLAKKETPCDKRETHVFQKDGMYWKQITGDTICGLDGDTGVDLLDILNTNDAKCIGIKNSLGRTLYTIEDFNPHRMCD